MVAQTRFTRTIDSLGRVTLPKDIRNQLGLDIHTPLAISCDGAKILIAPDVDTCALCGEPAGGSHRVINGRKLCGSCEETIRQSTPQHGQEASTL